MINRRYLLYIAGFVIILVLSVSAYYLVFQPQTKGSEIGTIPTTQVPSLIVPDTPTPTEITPTEVPVATLPPPLANVEFPMQTIEYPPDWPSELRYPEQFSVVETGSGTLPGGDSTGWAVKLRYGGEPTNAAEILSSFLLANGWQIVEHIELDTGGFLILIERGDKDGTGIIVIDRDPNDFENTNIVATIFP